MSSRAERCLGGLGLGATVLLVEDETSVRVTTALFLETLGCRVIAVTCPEDALREIAAREGEVQLLLTDVAMAGMSGHELAATVRREHPEVKIVYMSGFSEDAFQQADVVGEASSFLAKPFTRDELVHKLHEVLSI